MSYKSLAEFKARVHRECGKKIPHPTLAKAQAHAVSLGVWFLPYECRWCGRWHVGRSGNPPDLRGV